MKDSYVCVLADVSESHESLILAPGFSFEATVEIHSAGMKNAIHQAAVLFHAGTR